MSAAGRSVERMLRWDFDRVVLSHGDVLEDRAAFIGALFWMLGHPKLAASVPKQN